MKDAESKEKSKLYFSSYGHFCFKKKLYIFDEGVGVSAYLRDRAQAELLYVRGIMRLILDFLGKSNFFA